MCTFLLDIPTIFNLIMTVLLYPSPPPPKKISTKILALLITEQKHVYIYFLFTLSRT